MTTYMMACGHDTEDNLRVSEVCARCKEKSRNKGYRGETQQEPSKGAMRAANRAFDNLFAWLEDTYNVPANVSREHFARIIDEETQRPEWIECSERMPEEQTTVLVDGGIGYWNGEQWRSLTQQPYPGRIIEWEVTHWLPLPPSPEDK